MTSIMYLARMTSSEIADQLHKDGIKNGVVLPVGSFEQHGTLLPMECDTFIARKASENLAKSLRHDESFRVFILPDVTYTAVPGAESTPGTISVSFDLVGMTLHEILAGNSRSKWDFAIIINAHAQNHGRVIEAAMASTGGNHGRIFPVIVINIYEYSHICNELQIEAGSHGGEFELALYSYYAGKPISEGPSQNSVLPPKKRPANIFGLELMPRSFNGILAPKPPDVSAANSNAAKLGAMIDKEILSTVLDNLQIYFSEWHYTPTVS